MHKIPAYSGPFRKAFNSLKYKWDAYRGSIKGAAWASTFLDITGKTLTRLLVASPEPFKGKALNKGTRTWTNVRMLEGGKKGGRQEMREKGRAEGRKCL